MIYMTEFYSKFGIQDPTNWDPVMIQYSGSNWLGSSQESVSMIQVNGIQSTSRIQLTGTQSRFSIRDPTDWDRVKIQYLWSNWLGSSQDPGSIWLGSSQDSVSRIQLTRAQSRFSRKNITNWHPNRHWSKSSWEQINIPVLSTNWLGSYWDPTCAVYITSK